MEQTSVRQTCDDTLLGHRLGDTFLDSERKELRRAGLKVTHPRVQILAILDARRTQHMSAEEIYRVLLESSEEIGLATVYRVLTQFETAGIVSKHHFESGQAVFELNRGQHHDHMIDVETGKVIEFTSEEIEALQQRIAAQHGYDLEDHSLILYVRHKPSGTVHR